jgi:hypothetical protein
MGVARMADGTRARADEDIRDYNVAAHVPMGVPISTCESFSITL